MNHLVLETWDAKGAQFAVLFGNVDAFAGFGFVFSGFLEFNEVLDSLETKTIDGSVVDSKGVVSFFLGEFLVGSQIEVWVV